MSKKPIHSEDAPAAIGTYSQAIEHGGLVWLSGQIPLDPQTGELVQGDIEHHIHRVLLNMRAVAEAAGLTLNHLLKLNVYLTDLAHFASVNKVLKDFLSEPYPARAAIQVAALPRGAQVEMDGVLAR
jgi:reactive intermediate/imine deaminase